MTVIETSISRALPGRRQDAIAMGVEGAKLLERHGASVRMFTGQPAGEASGTLAFTALYENLEAWGESTDSLAADAEVTALLDRLYGADSPIVIESMSIGTEIPLGRQARAGEGTVLEAYVSRPVPGRFEACLELASSVFDYVESKGATGCRLMQLTAAGSLTDCLVASWEFASMAALGRMGDSFGTEPEGQRIMEMLMGPSSPVTTVTSGIYTQIPV
jgi:hypothetical protein